MSRGGSVARTEPRRHEWAVALLVSAAAVAIWFARAPFAPTSLWAEDGRNWLQDAIEVGPFEAFGRADAGYYHFLPRVGGAVASWVPLDRAALVTWTAGAMFMTWFVFTVFWASRAWLPNVVARVVLSLGLVLLPAHGDESIGNVANLHFVMLFVGAVVLVGEVERRWERVNACVVLVVLGLSTPVAVVLAPFVAYRVARRRPWRVDALTLAWVVGVVGQLLPMAVARPTRPSVEGAGLWSVGAQLVTGVVAGNYSPTDHAARFIGTILALALAALITAAVVVSQRRNDPARTFVLLAMPAVGAVCFAASALGFGVRSRYTLFPALCLLFAALVAVETLLDARGASPDATRWTFAGIGVLVLVAWLPSWGASDYRRSGPTWAQGLADAAQQCRDREAETVLVTIRPTDLPPDRRWTITVPCSEVLESESG